MRSKFMAKDDKGRPHLYRRGGRWDMVNTYGGTDGTGRAFMATRNSAARHWVNQRNADAAVDATEAGIAKMRANAKAQGCPVPRDDIEEVPNYGPFN